MYTLQHEVHHIIVDVAVEHLKLAFLVYYWVAQDSLPIDNRVNRAKDLVLIQRISLIFSQQSEINFGPPSITFLVIFNIFQILLK